MHVVKFLIVVFVVSVTGRRGIGIPVILLHDAEGGIVTIQLRNGDVLRGVLDDAQDNMNTVMKVLSYLGLSLWRLSLGNVPFCFLLLNALFSCAGLYANVA